MNRWIRVFVHDQGYGVWDSDNNPIDPDVLPISADLETVLGEWMGQYWNRREPMTTAQLEEFSQKGLIVARALKTELPTWTIIYYDDAAAARHEDDDWPFSESAAADPWEYEILDPLPVWLRRHELT